MVWHDYIFSVHPLNPTFLTGGLDFASCACVRKGWDAHHGSIVTNYGVGESRGQNYMPELFKASQNCQVWQFWQTPVDEQWSSNVLLPRLANIQDHSLQRPQPFGPSACTYATNVMKSGNRRSITNVGIQMNGRIEYLCVHDINEKLRSWRWPTMNE